MAQAYKAQCFCGAVEIEATGAPAVMGYCHCDDCQAWLAAPINAFSLWSPDSVRVTRGGGEIKTFNKTEGSYRKFCNRCGGHIMTDHPGMKLVDVYAPLLQGFTHQPTVHVHYANKSVSVKDGLPKFKDLPSQFGGTGETLAE
jgi:hypothetical protein